MKVKKKNKNKNSEKTQNVKRIKDIDKEKVHIKRDCLRKKKEKERKNVK